MQLEPVELRAMLASCVALLESQAKSVDVAIHLEVERDVPAVIRIDADKIAWCVTALLGNALRFVRRGTRLRPGGVIRIHVSAAPDHSVLVEISDDGAGIDSAVLERSRTRQPGRTHATALALNLVEDVVQAHGGTLTIQSSTKPDSSGTVVRINLPAA
jgi:signal transduction histidine kinase